MTGITAIVAIILGIVGIKKGKDPQVGGRGMAIAGIILGVMWLGGLAAFSGMIAKLFSGTAAEREFTKSFVTDLADGGSLDAAFKKTKRMELSDVQRLRRSIEGYGPVTDTTMIGASGQPGLTQVGGAITFGKQAKSFQAQVEKQPDGTLKITQFQFQ